MDTYEEILANKSTEIDALKTINGGDGLYASVNNVRRELTEEEYEDRKVLLATVEFDKQENGWLEDRKLNYPSVEECVHALLDGGDTLTDLQAARQIIKDTYPKP